MNTKKMREKLKLAGHTPARSNKDLKIQYKEVFSKPSEKSTELVKPEKILSIVPADNEYTYIGHGEGEPHMIKFMGIQNFMRGELTTVTDPVVLRKIKNNPCFVKGAYPRDKLFEDDEKAKKKADDQRFEDSKLQIEMERKQRKG